jgi:hypothetical protein
MSRRTSPLVVAGVAGAMVLGVWLAGEGARAWGQKKEILQPKWTHAFDLQVRKTGEEGFTDKTQKFGVEVFKDTNTGYGLYITDKGYVAAAPGFDKIDGAIKGPKDKDGKDGPPPGAKFVSGLDLKVRQPGVEKFSDKDKNWAMEVFYDPNTGNWIYITEEGRIAVTPGASPRGGALQAPKWIHGVDLRCRKSGVKEWKDAPKYSIEIYRDQNNGNLIYISHVGGIAVIPEGETKAKGADPEWLHGLDLGCRKSKEPNFDKDTRRWGIEIFHDDRTGNHVYISEAGMLAVAKPVNKSFKAPTPDPVKDPTFSHGLNLSARPSGQAAFGPNTPTYGAEVFRDENTGLTVHIIENGAITVVPTK